MTRNFLIGIFAMLMLPAISVCQEVEILDEQVGSEMLLYAKNLSKTQFEISVNIDVQGFTSKDKNPIIRTLQGDSTILLTRLMCPEGTACGYSTRLSYKRSLAATTGKDNGTKKQRTTSIQMNNNKINVFTMDGCGRCEFVINYLEENKIPYTELNTTMHEPNNELMFEQLQGAGFTGTSIQMPVVVSQGNVSFNIKDLKAFVKGLK